MARLPWITAPLHASQPQVAVLPQQPRTLLAAAPSTTPTPQRLLRASLTVQAVLRLQEADPLRTLQLLLRLQQPQVTHLPQVALQPQVFLLLRTPQLPVRP